MTTSKQTGTKRISFVFLIFILAGAAIIARLFLLQVIAGDYYVMLADRQQTKSNNSIEPRRGSIYFQNKEGEPVTAADTKIGYSIFINPRQLAADGANSEVVYDRLNAIIPIDKAYFMGRSDRSDDPFEEVATRVSEDTAVRVRTLKIPGVGVKSSEWRNYPAGSVASRVLGFLGFNGNNLEGRYGVERQYENALRGNYQNAGSGFLSGLTKIFAGPREGYDVVLTVNIDTQIYLEKTLAAAARKWRTKSAGGVILEPKTGKILALAALPNFDPNNYQKESDIHIFTNPLVESIYEFGSVFKPLTMAAALDKGAIKPTTKYYDKGFLILDSRRIENFDHKGRGEVDMQHVLDESLNTGAVFAMRQLGKENFYEYMVNYGLDSATGIDLPGEVFGSLSNLDTTRDIEYATASYGQGIAVTALAAARAFASLGNGGTLMRPYIVDRVARAGEPDIVTAPKSQGKVINTETSETISRMLVKVVDNALLGGTVKDSHYTIAAKTGTAFIPDKASGGYSEEMIHSIFGYAPGFDPRFLVFLYLERPSGAMYASHSLGEPMMDIMHFLLNYYNVPPDR